MYMTEVFAQNMPPDWTGVPLIVWGYQVLFAKEPIPVTPQAWNTAGVHCLLLSGSYTYYRTGKLRFGRPAHGSVEPNFAVESTPDGLWLLMGAPADVADSILRSAVAMLLVWLGRNLVYERYFGFRVDPPSTQVAVWTAAMLNPMHFPSPDFGRLSHVETASRSLAGLSDTDRYRLLLSLRWFSDSLNFSGTDQFLRLWIAFEVLAMSTTNVKSAADFLATTYGLTKDSATTILRIGRIHGLRSAIVHKGSATSPSTLVINFLEAVYTDCVSFRLTGTSNRSAFRLLDVLSAELD